MIDPKQGPLFPPRRDAVAPKFSFRDPGGVSADTMSERKVGGARPFASKRKFSFVGC